MADVVNPLQSTSYTNKDFTSIYIELLDLTKELASTWDPSISNESDPGVILLKLNAIIGDKLSYNSDTNVLELFPLSVTQEKNARQLFEQLGYYMHWYKAATTNVAIAWMGDKSSTTEYTIPAFTMVSDFNNNIVYTLIGPSDNTTVNTFEVGDQKLKLDGSTISFKAIQGVPVRYSINGETLITINNLDSDNRLYFPTIDVAENGIFITNAGANNYTDWKKVDNLLVKSVSSSGTYYKFGVTQDTSTCYIEFPSNAEELFKGGINVTYIKTLGAEGNVSYKTIEKFYNEISPVEDSSVVFNTNNIRMLNYSSAINGEDTQTINSAYKGYKSTIGIFETLVTLRDYIGYILNSGLVSNGFVCDRTDDVQCTYNIMTQSNDIDQLVTMVELDSNNSPALSAFDLKLYLLQLPTSEMTSAVAYNSTFDIIDEAHQENIKAYIDDVKCISHDYASILPITSTKSHFCYFKNKYPISCRIVTQYQLTNISANEVVTHIREALYNTLNAQEVTFGEEISAELVYNTILNSDERIKNVMLDNIEYSTYAVCYSEAAGTFFEVEISSDDENPISVITNKGVNFTVSVDEQTFTEKIGIGNYAAQKFIYDSADTAWKLNGTAVTISQYGITVTGTPSNSDYIIVSISIKTQLKEEVLVKSILAGTTQFLVQDEEFDYRLDQVYNQEETSILDRIKAVKTNVDINMTAASSTYALKNNETIQLYSPNLIDSTTYSTYVKFEYRLENALLSEEDYQLGTNEYFIMYWKESQSDSYYKYAVYGQGNIIKINSFDLPANDGSNNIGAELVNYVENIGTLDSPIYYTDSKIDNRMTYTISQEVANISSSINTLSTTKSIVIRKINQIELTAGDSYCYWILNEKVSTSNNKEVYRLFEEGEYTKLLNSGEYFIYTDSTLTNLTILGSGTFINRTDATYVWEVEVKDAADIIENGVSAFTEDSWFKIVPSSTSLFLTEQYYINIIPGSEFKLLLARNREDYCTATIESDPSSLSPSIDQETWFSNTSGYGTYIFTYNGAAWTYQTTEVSLADYGISITGSPSNGNTITITVSNWTIKITSESTQKYYGGVWTDISLKDFDISYRDANSTVFNTVLALNLNSSDYSWNARSLLALNTSSIKEQILLSNQSVTAFLSNKWILENPITVASETSFYFVINDVNYAFTYSLDIDSIVFDLNEEVLLVNDVSTPYSEETVGTELIELTNEYTIQGADLVSSPQVYYPTAFFGSFDLTMDGGQTLSTYKVNEDLEIEYFKLYVYRKNLSNNTQIHMLDNGEIDLEFTTSSQTISIPFNLPTGEYILPVVVGSEDLEVSGAFNISLNGTNLHIINDENVENFNKKQTYYVYMNIISSLSNTLTLTISGNSKNIPVILSNIYKYNYKEGLTAFESRKIATLINQWDRDSLFNYTYKVSEDDEISNPLAGKSFFLNNHVFNKFTIAQMANSTDISILGKK